MLLIVLFMQINTRKFILGGIPGQHNPPPSILYPVSAHAINAAAAQQHQAAAAAAAQQQQSGQPPTPGAQQ